MPAAAQEVCVMDIRNRFTWKQNPKIRIEKPTIEKSLPADVAAEVKKYLALVPSEPEPNLGRVREIKEEIAKGSYLSRDKIEDVASLLAIRFLKGEQ